ncbi:MAG TPA: histidine kinase dimerization/phospho-acceptor domain-containing protein, partial [Planctomycetota bacterium]|nr:histidine kinase dimerization/phospho-acceptor domain-containing protein [Planctomycetota bacterium]
MPQGSPNKVLVVAGADFHLASLEPALAGRYELRHVDSGDAALETLREFAADVVLLDMIAPDLDAWATCRRITSGRRHQGPKVLLVADQDRAVDRGRGREVGACDFVTRAIDQDDLRARIELLLELKKAQDDSMAKSEFVANISHEIRTPMTAILGYSENLRDATLSEPARSQALDTIWRNGQHLLDLINNILDISKIEAQKLQVERVECCPAEILAEVAAMMRARAESSGLTLTVALDGAIPVTLLSDRTRIKQILVNLVGNAIKFTHRGGVRIVARFLDTGAQPLLEIDVIDTGIGIDEQTIPLLGQPFVQAEAGLARRHGGTGLGLSI